MSMSAFGQALHVGDKIDELLDGHRVVVAGHLRPTVSAEIPFVFILMVLDPPGHGGIRVDHRLDEILCGVHRPHPRESRPHIALFSFRCGKGLASNFMTLKTFKVGKDLASGVMISGRYGKTPPLGRRKTRLLLYCSTWLHVLLRRHHHRVMMMSTHLRGFI